MRFSTRFNPFFRQKRQATNASGMIRSVAITFQVRPNPLDPFSEMLFATREIVRLGLAKKAAATPWGIFAEGVPANRLEDLRSHVASMGANRWWVAN